MKKWRSRKKRIVLTKIQLLERMRIIEQLKLKPVDKSLDNTN